MRPARMTDDIGNRRTQSMETQLGERQRRKSSPPLTPEARLQKKINFYKWSLGIVIGIFVAGFGAANYVGAFATKADVETKAEERDVLHKEVHKTVNGQIEKLNERTVKIYGEQRAGAERDKLVQAQMDYLIEASEQPRARSAPKRRIMRRKITEQAAKVKEVEDDPLSGLDF